MRTPLCQMAFDHRRRWPEEPARDGFTEAMASRGRSATRR